MKKVFITGADRGIGFALCRRFLEGGWMVFAGRFMEEWAELDGLQAEYGDRLFLVSLNVGSEESVDRAAKAVKGQTDVLDMLVNCAGIIQSDGREAIARCLNINAFGVIRMVEAFLPLLKQGEKRLCFVSSEAGSITLAHRDGDIAYCVSKTCLNMAVRLMFEKLQPEGYRFRLYHPGWVRSYMSGQKSTVGNFEPEETAQTAYQQFTSDRDWEDVLIMTDVSNEMWPF
ncbi:MAG: SDR family NAD(P)-dependent oxidoreductase [Lachnospiraceae bacterium]|jgi:NAD(P)-dependent dehydrogenase (short-subunit alcohol dehydrogenase family)|nr:SDR family NAD(P)-dependent oxidoreductase [Lachnospiraceae bacterium]